MFASIPGLYLVFSRELCHIWALTSDTRVLDCFPQRIDRASFLHALHLAREIADPAFRVGYNSLGAFTTINHLHFQVIKLAFCNLVRYDSSRSSLFDFINCLNCLLTCILLLTSITNRESNKFQINDQQGDKG